MYTDTVIETGVKGRFPLATHSTLQVLVCSTLLPNSAVTGYEPAPGKTYFHLDSNKFHFTNGWVTYGSVIKETWPDIICVVCVVTHLLPFYHQQSWGEGNDVTYYGSGCWKDVGKFVLTAPRT